MQTIPLNDGHEIPALGLGVWKANGPQECYNAVRAALKAGYRHIDTAMIYKNEGDVGRAIRDSGVERSSVFVTTKLWNDDQGYDSALRAFDASLKSLGFDYIDLYLIHFPVSHSRKDSWRALERIKQEGRARSIGVSNYTVRHLQELLASSATIPAINQVEFHPFLYQRELHELCLTNGIALQAYSPLAQGEKLTDPTIVRLATKYAKSPAQVLIRWAIEKRIVVIPKSTNPKRIAENFAVWDFTLTPDDVKALDALNCNYRTCWDPTEVP